jgi:cytochrome c553
MRCALIATIFSTACFTSPANAADVAAGRTKAVQCQACHGMDGIAKIPEAPNLAGQNEDYLVKALRDFKSGARQRRDVGIQGSNLAGLLDSYLTSTDTNLRTLSR